MISWTHNIGAGKPTPLENVLGKNELMSSVDDKQSSISSELLPNPPISHISPLGVTVLLANSLVWNSE